jgi:viroplasmin and RNaseH domain-containing protein
VREMLDYVKVIWNSWNKVPNQTHRIFRDNQFKIFYSMEEADEFIEELKQSPGTVQFHKETYEFFRVNDFDKAASAD